LALIVCKSCKKAFISGPKEEEVCTDCVARLNELYPLVRNFLRNHYEVFTVKSLSKTMGLAPEEVESLVSMGLLEYRDNRKEESGDKPVFYARSRHKY